MPSAIHQIFLGRDRQLADFDRFLAAFLSPSAPPPRPQIVLLWGQGGIGKTTLLNAFRQRLGPEGPFRPALLEIDWHEEQKKAPQRFPSVADQVSAQAVFDVINSQAATLPGWAKARKPFDEARERIGKAKERAEKAYASLREVRTAERSSSSAGAEVVAKTAGEAASMSGVPLLKPLVEWLVKAGINVAPQLAESLRAKLSPGDLDLIEGFELHLARGLGESLANLSESSTAHRLLVIFDTYEIVDERDPLVREIIRAAGPRLAWVIAGRRDLYDSRSQALRGRFDGYLVGEGHDWDVRPIDVKALAREEIRTFFHEAAPDRPTLSDDELARVHLATGAIPLAIRLAGEIWQQGRTIEEIATEESLPKDRIVEEMVSRYEQHCVGQDLHRTALAAIALAEGDAELLDALLLPEPGIGNAEGALRSLLGLVLDRYASVFKESVGVPRLHDEPARFYRERMRRLRHEAWVRALNERAIAYLSSRLRNLWTYYGNLEELCTDDDYVRGAVRLTDHLFWLNEIEAWTWLTARFVEGVGYSSELREGLLDVANSWRSELKAIGQKRLKVLVAAEDAPWLAEPLQARRHLLEEDERRGWLGETRLNPDRFAPERRAILLWSAAQAYFQAKQFDEALALLKQAESLVPSERELAQRLADLGLRVGYEFFFERPERKDERSALEAVQLAARLNPSSSQTQSELGAAYSQLKEYKKAIIHHRRAIDLNPEDGTAWRQLGNDYSWLNDYEKAIEHHRKAIELNPQDGENWRQLGNDYSWLNDYEKAIEHHRKAIELNAQDGDAWRELGNDFSNLKDYEKAIEHHRKAIELNPQDGYAWRALGNDYSSLKDYEKAIEYHRKATELNPQDGYAWRELGTDFSNLKDYEQAIEHYRKAIELNPQDGYLLRDLGSGFILIGRYSEAPELLERAYTIDPNEASIRVWLGYYAMICGDVKKASSHFEKVRELDSQLGWAVRVWACLLYRLGDWPLALGKAREAASLERERAPLTALALERLVNGTVDLDREDISEGVARERNSLVDAQWLALQGKKAEALDKLGEAIERTPDEAAFARFLPAFHDLRSDPRFVAMTRDVPGATWTDFPPAGSPQQASGG